MNPRKQVHTHAHLIAGHAGHHDVKEDEMREGFIVVALEVVQRVEPVHALMHHVPGIEKDRVEVTRDAMDRVQGMENDGQSSDDAK
jgi:hypothetical protein